MQPPRWLLLACVIVVSGIGLLSKPQYANAYSCTSSHCYGTVAWNGLVTGSNVRIRAATTNMNSGTRFISNEMWLMDLSGASCTVQGFSSGGTTWVETSFLARSGAYTFFWADCRPGKPFFSEVLASVPASVYGTSPYFSINRPSTAPTFSVTITSSGFSANRTSIDNTMAPDRIRIGTELFGSSGGFFGTASWTHSRYVHNNNHIYQHRTGDSTIVNAPVQGWWQVPAAPGNNGGDWRTFCQCGT